MIDEREGVPGLHPEVVTRIAVELGGRAGKALACLRPAGAFLAQARVDGSGGLRLAESAAYNLQEAFDAVVQDR